MNDWVRLQEGNSRYATGRSNAGTARGTTRRRELLAGQQPFALVLGCSDSRVPVEVVFDQGLGDLFVVRTAGHVVDDAVLGSLEYGVGVLGVSTLLVLGHAGCGAVAAGVALADGGSPPSGHVLGIAQRIATSVTTARTHGTTTMDGYVEHHAADTVEELRRASDLLSENEFHGRLTLLAGAYDLGTGIVRAVTRHRSVPAPTPGVVHSPAITGFTIGHTVN